MTQLDALMSLNFLEDLRLFIAIQLRTGSYSNCYCYYESIDASNCWIFRISEEDPWIAKALAAIGRAILADKAEAAQRHYANFETVPLPFENPTSSVRRRSSALRSAALFQKFKDFARSEVDAGKEVLALSCLKLFVSIVFIFISKNHPILPGFLSYKGCIAAIRQLPLHSIEQELGFTLDEDRMIRVRNQLVFIKIINPQFRFSWLVQSISPNLVTLIIWSS